jgi:hypothetical protein
MRFRAYAIPDAEEGRTGTVIDEWLARWRADVFNFSDTGCGCCVHILEFDASDEAIQELEDKLGWNFDRHPEGQSAGGAYTNGPRKGS